MPAFIIGSFVTRGLKPALLVAAAAALAANRLDDTLEARFFHGFGDLLQLLFCHDAAASRLEDILEPKALVSITIGDAPLAYLAASARQTNIFANQNPFGD